MEKPVSWSACGQICFVDGKAYGLTNKLQRICLGEEAEIKKKLAQGEEAVGLVSSIVSKPLQSITDRLKPSKATIYHQRRKVSVK